mgnify:CR=1 FL=1
MPKYGENIYHRKDGRWEARYIAMRLPNGKAKYKSVYGRTHDIAKKKQLAAMQALEETDRAILQLQYGQGMTGAQIAAALGLHAATVRQRSRRARQKLKQLLEQEGLTL